MKQKGGHSERELDDRRGNGKQKRHANSSARLSCGAREKMSETLFMQTTNILAIESASEITALLVKAGANQVTTDYRKGQISGVRFALSIAGAFYTFELPARTEPVYKLLLKNKPFNSYRRCSLQQYQEEMRQTAERVGWRQLYRWVQAQLAMIDTGMVVAHEVFLPYMLVGKGQTVLQMFEEQRFKMLTAGDRKNSEHEGV